MESLSVEAASKECIVQYCWFKEFKDWLSCWGFFHVSYDLQMEEDNGLDLKLQGTFVSCVVAVWEWLTVLGLQKQHCRGSRSTECGTSSIELTFYLNFKAICPLVEACCGLFILYPTTEQQMQLVIKTHKQLLSVVRLQWRNVFYIEVVTCLKKFVCSKDSYVNYSSLPSPVLLVRIEWFRILRIGVNSHISRFLAVLLEIWATVGLSYGSANLSGYYSLSPFEAVVVLRKWAWIST